MIYNSSYFQATPVAGAPKASNTVTTTPSGGWSHTRTYMPLRSSAPIRPVWGPAYSHRCFKCMLSIPMALNI